MALEPTVVQALLPEQRTLYDRAQAMPEQDRLMVEASLLKEYNSRRALEDMLNALSAENTALQLNRDEMKRAYDASVESGDAKLKKLESILELGFYCSDIVRSDREVEINEDALLRKIGEYLVGHPESPYGSFTFSLIDHDDKNRRVLKGKVAVNRSLSKGEVGDFLKSYVKQVDSDTESIGCKAAREANVVYGTSIGGKLKNTNTSAQLSIPLLDAEGRVYAVIDLGLKEAGVYSGLQEASGKIMGLFISQAYQIITRRKKDMNMGKEVTVGGVLHSIAQPLTVAYCQSQMAESALGEARPLLEQSEILALIKYTTLDEVALAKIKEILSEMHGLSDASHGLLNQGLKDSNQALAELKRVCDKIRTAEFHTLKYLSADAEDESRILAIDDAPPART